MGETIPATTHESIKEDFEIDVKEADIKVKAYRDFVAIIAKEIGTTQETEAIKARIYTLVAKESKLRDIVDNRPLTRHPFEGLGEQVVKLTKNINKVFRLLIKKLNEKNNSIRG
jgi:hypothetical protein